MDEFCNGTPLWNGKSLSKSFSVCDCTDSFSLGYIAWLGLINLLPFHDLNLTWNGDSPEFTECFQNTVLVAVASGWLWITSPIYLWYLCTSKGESLPWSWKSIIKTLYDTDVLNFTVFFTYFGLTLIQFFVSCIADNPPQVYTGKTPCPILRSSFLSRITFAWETGKEAIKAQKRQRSKPERKVYVNPSVSQIQDDQSETTPLLKEKPDAKESKKDTRRPLLIAFTDADKNLEGSTEWKQEWKGFVLAAAFFSVVLLQSFFFHQLFYFSQSLGLRIRAAIISRVYRKVMISIIKILALTMDNQARKDSTVGEIVNLMSVDTEHIQEVLAYLWAIWSSPLQIIVALYLLYQTLGPSMFAGFGAMVIMIPVNGFLFSHKLKVINMNQQSDSSDLLGGFKPVDLRHIVKPFREDFENIFRGTFNQKENTTFLGHIQQCFVKQNWSTMFTLIGHTVEPALKRYQTGKISSEMYDNWVNIKKRLQQLKLQVKETENVLAFAFIEGTLVQAIRYGDWVLLDEINLAAAETLDCLSGLLESRSGSVVLTERGDVEPIIRHDNFRLFACMNPATDVGKKDLSVGIRNRFTELYVDELLETQDLKILVNDYLRGLSLTGSQLNGIVKFYTVVRDESIKHLTDGTGHRPHFSLRTLCRALKFAAPNPCGIFFLTQLDRSSHPLVENLICQHVIGKANVKAMLKQQLPMPPGGVYLKFEGYWISAGSLSPSVPDNYILTPSVRANLHDLARIVSGGQYPVLLQGETSVGKTSLVTWLGRSSGNVCVRVNNHEHTDLQEYVGSYSADSSGKLVFKEGVLVEAMRKGHWIILDELNLAPTDVLEALNRLLDDNRELFIPETQQTVKAHPKFMLFATQNPPGQYGGRKMLSRAFRNRFVELHFDEIPSNELETILHNRCHIPMSYAKRLVAVIWAERYKCMDSIQSSRFYDWDQHLADHGYMLLAGRVRKQEEAAVVQEVIQKHLKRSVNPDHLFTFNSMTSATSVDILKSVTQQSLEGFEHVVWTYNMRRLAVLIGQAIKYQEPILFVGETGCGKTTVCQMYSVLHKTKLHSINCHLHTESADFLGGLRPCRTHEKNQDGGEKLFEWVDGPLVLAMKEGSMFLVDEISLADDSVLERLNSVLEPERTLLLAEKCGGDGNQNEVEKITAGDSFRIFATMNPGGDFGKKELSPALRNRFTEIWCPQSSSRDDLIAIIEHNVKSGIHLCNQEDGTSGIGKAIMEFVDWFRNNEIGKRCVVSIRDILSWVSFINICSKTLVTEEDVQEESVCNQLDPALAFIHGACLAQQVEARILMLNTPGPVTNSYQEKYALTAPTTCVNAQRILRGLQLARPLLLEGSPGVGKTSLVSAIAKASGHELVRINLSEQTDVTDLFGADLPVEGADGGVFAWRDGPLLQALKAGHWIVLDELNLASQSVLEGLNACLDHRGEVYIPELGKTFHIQHQKTRLFACQNPLNQGGGRKGLPRSFLNRFTQHHWTWPFACQNFIYQGRGRKGLPRSFLNRIIQIQNVKRLVVYVEPLSFTDLLFIAQTMYPKIPISKLECMVRFNMEVRYSDFFILHHTGVTPLKLSLDTCIFGLYVLSSRLKFMILANSGSFNEVYLMDIKNLLNVNEIYKETMVDVLWGQRGSPWEFNLRDLFRWCDLLIENQKLKKSLTDLNPGEFVGLVYRDRMRTLTDKQKASIELQHHYIAK
ncbi:LOW QUALITY PROTEIN: hypothetical protein KUTeg_007940 [Tegillarca granosa]|uniref:ABC transmembrane type-1 domain-containing protein n=1 Tax=Tegillarca granosa TaxID=220873 RepID=A0ABQ9FHM7_TEGGR|nr:LOW QUALITY PROTEIN: hypothetical protein KUTeg_007940 [Tegillarca granosa]